MVIGIAPDVEVVGVRERGRVAVGGAVENHHHHSLAHLRPAQFTIYGDVPSGRLHRTVPAQNLLDRTRHQRRSTAQRLNLRGMSHQCIEPVTDKVGGGFIARQQQQVEEPRDLVEAKRVLFLSLDQHAHQIVARLSPQLLVARLEINALGSQGLFEPRRGWGLGRHVAYCNQRLRPFLENLVVCRGHTEELGDHHRGQRLGEVLHHLEVPLPLDRGQQTVRDLTDPRLHLADAPWREGLTYQTPKPGVYGRVAQDEGGHAVKNTRLRHLQDRGAGKRARIAQRRDHIRVASQQYGWKVQFQNQRRSSVERFVQRVRIAKRSGVKTIEARLGRSLFHLYHSKGPAYRCMRFLSRP